MDTIIFLPRITTPITISTSHHEVAMMSVGYTQTQKVTTILLALPYLFVPDTVQNLNMLFFWYFGLTCFFSDASPPCDCLLPCVNSNNRLLLLLSLLSSSLPIQADAESHSLPELGDFF